jgi:hypothetical protein
MSRSYSTSTRTKLWRLIVAIACLRLPEYVETRNSTRQRRHVVGRTVSKSICWRPDVA